MKKILCLITLAVLLSFTDQSPAQAETDATATPASYIRTFSAPTCSFWNSIRDNYGMVAYACSSYPMQQTFADGYDVQRVVVALETKVADLEKRVAELEKMLPRP